MVHIAIAVIWDQSRSRRRCTTPSDVAGPLAFGIKQVCPICRVDLPPGPEQLFEEATRRYFDVQRRVDRGEASWGVKTKQREMDEVLLLWRSAAEQGHAGGQ